MDTAGITAVVAASTSVIVTVITHYLQKKREDEKQWRTERFGYYRDLVRSISDTVDGNRVEGADKQFADCNNSAPLYASVDVVKALYDFRHTIRVSATPEERTASDRLLTVLVDAIRRDLGLRGALRDQGIEVLLWTAGDPGRSKSSRL